MNPAACCSTPRLIPRFIDPPRADEYLAWLQQEIDWQQETFTIFGRTRAVPRTLAWAGDEGVAYRYTGITHRAEGWPRKLVALKQSVEQLCGQSFNFVLLNRYEGGAQYMGWHRDDEPQCTTYIASLSFGATRRFRLQACAQGQSTPYELEHGSLLIFDGRLRHTLCQTRREVATRINLTFRQVQV